jgi:hypothetical protein
MEIIRHNTGKDAGHISVLHTIRTMEIGETWDAPESDVVVEYARNACSRYSYISGRAYTVNAPKDREGIIRITRTK